MEPFTKSRINEHVSLRALLEKNPDRVWRIPGVWDGMSALLADQAGFQIISSSGWAISSNLGLPDAGLYSYRENLNVVANIRKNTNAALIADIDTGYGNAINAAHIIREAEFAGVDAVFIEDQVTPKRCNYSADEGVPVTALRDAASKVRAVVEHRMNPDTVIIARTDAEGPQIKDRAEAFLEAGADFVLPIASNAAASRSVVEELHHTIGPNRIALSTPPGAWHWALSEAELKEMGVVMVMNHVDTYFAVVEALKRHLAELAQSETPQEVTVPTMPYPEFAELIGFGPLHELERRYDT
ncbi:MAG TPA: isocitrate lyase/PEP mutase family protein [Terrimesophilobacter sp.]|nr:isocitrate lyase/PEP mutase family protein [Terrimesophilobacter sp.]